jgi:hypothetical protein
VRLIAFTQSPAGAKFFDAQERGLRAATSSATGVMLREMAKKQLLINAAFALFLIVNY